MFSPIWSCQMYNFDWPSICPMSEENEALACARDFMNFANLSDNIVSCSKNVFEREASPGFTNTVATEFNIVCDRAHMNSKLTGAFMAGMFAGVFIGGIIMDRLGRKLACLMGQIGSVVVNLAIAFSSGIWMYAGLRFLAAFFSMLQATSCFVTLRPLS